MENNNIHIESNPLKGILICLLAYFVVALIGACKKSIHPDVSLSTILFFQNVICFLLILVELRPSKINLFAIKHVNTYVVRIASGLGCYATLFYIIKFLPLSEGFLYQYSASLWLPLITSVWLGTKMPKYNWFGIVIGFVGIVIILQPKEVSLGLIAIVGIVCGILQAISVVAIRKLSMTEPIQKLLFYYFLVGVLVSGCLMINTKFTLHLVDVPGLLGVGITTFVAQKLLTVSLKYAHATTLAPVCYTSILFSGVLGWIFWNEIPNRIELAGMGVVIFGCLLSVFISKVTRPNVQVLAYEKQ